LANTELPSVELILSATAPLPQELAQRAEAEYDTRVLEIYGSTETGAVATRRPACDPVWQTLPGVSLAQRKQRWWLSAEHLPDPVPLNDLFRLESDDRFSLLGRDADLIKVAGNRASLADLNQKLLAIEGVVDGTFFLPDSDPGINARLACLAVAPRIGQEQILDALRQTLDPAFLPRPLFRVSALPRSTTGKLPRQALLDLYERCNRSGQA
jgi:acyl-coenzyme A synthetase/AMP-(fatty) acid ligase